jgi:hypothetical protein
MFGRLLTGLIAVACDMTYRKDGEAERMERIALVVAAVLALVFGAGIVLALRLKG